MAHKITISLLVAGLPADVVWARVDNGLSGFLRNVVTALGNDSA